MKKRVISLFTSLAIAITMFFGFPSAKAAATFSCSADDALNYLRCVGGDYQCVQYVNLYFQYICGRQFVIHYPNWLVQNQGDLSSHGFTFIAGAQPQKGDVLVWTFGQYGHVAVYESENSWYDANYNNDRLIRHHTTNWRSACSGYWGVIRPNFNTSSLPSVPDVPTYAVTNNVYQLRCAGGPGYQANVYGGADQNGTSVCTWAFDGSNEQLFRFYHENSGKYWIYAMCSSGGTNRVLDVNVGADNILNIGDGIDLWTRGGYDNCQLFNVVPIGGNKYILELSSMHNAVIGVTEHANGKQLTLQRYTGSDSQHWYLVDPYVEGTCSPKACTHKYIESVSKQPTCTQPGVKTTVCAWCSSVKNEDIPCISHNFSSSWTTDIYPTCTSAGSKSRHCTMCDAKTDTTSISALGHSWNSGTITENATCISSGVLTKTCTTCWATTTAEIPQTSHNFSSSWTIDIYPTCISAGSKSHHCTICDTKTDITGISAQGHSWDNGKITKNPTYTSTGTKVYTCALCKTVRSESIPMLTQLPAPQNLKATAGERKITLTWSAVSGAKKYRIQRYNGSAWATIATVSSTSYTNTGLSNGTRYNYRVLASADGTSWGSPSTAANAVTIKRVSAPANLKAVPSNRSVKLTWSAVSGAKKYRIQRLNGSTWRTIATVSSTSYTNTGLSNGTQYRYRVLASADGSVWSGASAVVLAAPAAKLPAPSNIRAVSSNRSVNLTWSAVSGAKKYRIQRLNGSTWRTIATVSSTSYTNTGLSNGTQYRYRVLASSDGSSWGNASSVVASIPRA